MLIRSQNKEVLVAFENLLNIEVSSGGVISTRVDIGWSCLLGEYSTKEKAVKVLDMIQESYTNGKVAQILSHGLGMVPTKEINEASKIIKNAIQSSTVFQMPEDGSVEV